MLGGLYGGGESLLKRERLFVIFPCNKAGKALVRKHHPQAG